MAEAINFNKFLGDSTALASYERLSNYIDERIRDCMQVEKAALGDEFAQELAKRDAAIERLASWIEGLSVQSRFDLAMKVIQNFEDDDELYKKAARIVEGVLDAALPPEADGAGVASGEDREPQSEAESAPGASEGHQSTYMGAAIQE